MLFEWRDGERVTRQEARRVVMHAEGVAGAVVDDLQIFRGSESLEGELREGGEPALQLPQQRRLRCTHEDRTRRPLGRAAVAHRERLLQFGAREGDQLFALGVAEEMTDEEGKRAERERLHRPRRPIRKLQPSHVPHCHPFPAIRRWRRRRRRGGSRVSASGEGLRVGVPARRLRLLPLRRADVAHQMVCLHVTFAMTQRRGAMLRRVREVVSCAALGQEHGQVVVGLPVSR